MTALWSYGPLFFCFLFLILHQSLVGNLANLTGQQPQKALPIPTHVCSNCVQTAWLPVLGISNACTDNDDVIAQGGCTDTIRESALKVEKSLATVGSRGQRSVHASRERQWLHTSVAPSRRLEWSSRDSGYTQVLPPQGDWSGHPERDSGYTQVLPTKEAKVDIHRETVATHKCCPLKEAKADIHRETVATHKCCPLKEAKVDIHRETVATHKCCPPRRLKQTPTERQWLHTSVAHQGG